LTRTCSRIGCGRPERWKQPVEPDLFAPADPLTTPSDACAC
jgi:hypothetical protein